MRPQDGFQFFRLLLVGQRGIVADGLLLLFGGAAIHNFVLEQESGGKLEKDLTKVPFTGTNVYSITLAKGTYKYYCKPHEATMHGSFTVS